MLVGYLFISLEKCIFKSFAHFLIEIFGFLLLSYRHSLYILDINPLFDMICKFFLPCAVGCFLTLLTASFAVQKILTLM